jgi:EAL domain-containing protein (putative c-di-GMP-specific phosphodiesterase class I)
MQVDLSKRNQISRDISVALLDHQFVLYYQPVVDNQGVVFGAEALLRWNHPVRGLVSPSEFIHLAEQGGLIVPLGHWVLHTASLQLALWAKNPLTTHFTLAVNVSAQQFHEADFVTHVLSTIKKTGADTSKLKIEITESILIQDMEDIVAKMNVLKSAGIGFSLDDFGTGFSSLNYLKRLPLDQIKIDQSFVRDILSKPKDAMIARTIISLGHDLGLVVIAEGVENENQRDFLIENGCYAFQGFMFSGPLPVKAFESFAKASLD